MSRFSMPVKTFLNCTMPALVNIRVGSLRGTSELEGTISWPFFSKYRRKCDRISLTPLIWPGLELGSRDGTARGPARRRLGRSFRARRAAPHAECASPPVARQGASQLERELLEHGVGK